MGYCIQYDRIPVKQEIRNKKRFLKPVLICVFLLASAALSLIPQVRMVVARIIFPGISTEGTQALETFASQIWKGDSLEEAFRSFCIQVFSFVNE